MLANPSKHLAFPVATEKRLGDLVPYSAHVAPDVLATYDGACFSIIGFTGTHYEGHGATALAAELAHRAQLFKLIDNPNLSLHYLQIKRQMPPPTAAGGNTFFDLLYRKYADGDPHPFYTIEHYVCLFHHTPLNTTLSFLDFIKGFNTAGTDREALNTRIEALRTATRRLLTALQSYTPRVLGLVDHDGYTYSEPLSILYYLINHETKHIPLHTTELNHHLCTQRYDFSSDGTGRVGDHLFASKSIKETDTILHAGCLDELLWLPCEWILSLSFRFTLQSEAVSRIKRQYRLLHQAQDAGITQIEALQLALDQLASGDIVMGESCFHLLYFAEDPATLTANGEAITQVFDHAGLITVDDAIAVEAKYLATLPGNWRYRTRVTTGLHSQNLAALTTYRQLPSGQQAHHWGDAPLAVMRTSADTAYSLALHVHDLGNTVVVGQSGGGKTVLMSFLAACCARAGAKIVYYDKDRGAEIFIRAAGGTYHVIEPGTPTGFNPFALPDTPYNHAFAAALIQTLIEIGKVTFTSGTLHNLAQAVAYAFTLPPGERQLRKLAEFLPTGDDRALADGLAPWINAGAHAWLFDNPPHRGDPYAEHRVLGFDLTHILDMPELKGVAHRYITHLIDQHVLTGQRACIVIDEGWRALDDPAFAAQIKDLAKTIRKKNGVLMFGSNHPGDLIRNAAGEDIINQSPTKIFTPNQEGKPEDYRGYRLTSDQINLILSLHKDSHAFVLVQNEETARLTFDLAALPELIALLSARESTVRDMHQLIDTHGPRPHDWLPHFHPDLADLYAY